MFHRFEAFFVVFNFWKAYSLHLTMTGDCDMSPKFCAIFLRNFLPENSLHKSMIQLRLRTKISTTRFSCLNNGYSVGLISKQTKKLECNKK